MEKEKKYLCYNLIYYKPKLWEKVVLFFFPLLTHEAPGALVFYKKFSNRLYIFGYIRMQGSDDTYTTGSNITQQNNDTRTGFDNAGNN